MTEQQTPKKIRSGHYKQHIIPLIVWFGCVGAIVGLFANRQQQFNVLGHAQSEIVRVTAPQNGALRKVTFDLYDRVHAGQILVRLDDTQLQAEIATAQAITQKLIAQLQQTETSLKTEEADRNVVWLADHRQFMVDTEETRLTVLTYKGEIEIDQIKLENIELEIQITQELLAQEAISPYEMKDVQIRHRTLQTQIQENQSQLAQAQKALEQSLARRDKFTQHKPVPPTLDQALAVIRKSIDVQEKRMAELTIAHQFLTLRSPCAGTISSIGAFTGQSIMKGELIATIAQEQPEYIVAYADENRVNQIQIGHPVELIKNSLPPQKAQSQVTQIGPVMEQIPQRLRQNPNIIQWGRPLLIPITPGMNLIPGEVVGLRGL